MKPALSILQMVLFFSFCTARICAPPGGELKYPFFFRAKALSRVIRNIRRFGSIFGGALLATPLADRPNRRSTATGR